MKPITAWRYSRKRTDTLYMSMEQTKTAKTLTDPRTLAPSRSNFFHFHTVLLENFSQIIGWCPIFGVGTHNLGNLDPPLKRLFITFGFFT